MACADPDTLAALVGGALSDSARAAIAIHAAGCENCHAVIEGLIDSRAFDETIDSNQSKPRSTTEPVGEGTQIGRYTIRERLGAGGMGVVYAAVDSELHRRVAVKLLRADHHGQLGTQGRERMMREARTLARLSHPNVVTVYDVGTHGDNVFLAMELVDGGNLTAWIKRAPRTFNELVDRMIEAGRGLAAAHAAGVVHRDVKPDNVLVGRDGRARMTDFGLARVEDIAPLADETMGPSPDSGSELTRTGTLMGTPVYMSPEQMSRGSIEPRSDQWSFCAMLYEVFAGVRPFSIDNLETRSAQIEAGRLAPPAPGRRVPAWLRKIVVRGLHVDPARRWPSMDAVVESLARGRKRRGRIALAFALAGTAAAIAITMVALARRDDRGGAPVEFSEASFEDNRPGCKCPLSACPGHCVSQCNARAYKVGAELPGVNLAGRQEAVLGASSDGNTLLYLAGKRCAVDRMFLAKRYAAIYFPVDITDQLDRTRVDVFEGCCTLAADGTSIIFAKPKRAGFVRVSLAGTRVGPIVEDLGPDVGPEERITFGNPVLSADGLTFFFRVFDRREGPSVIGPLEGSFMTRRTDHRTPFPLGQPLGGSGRHYEYPSGISEDGLSLFMTNEYRTRVIVRASTGEPFGNPGDTLGMSMVPILMPGWRAVPVEGCQRIIETSSPGGCEQESIKWLEPVP